MRTILFLVRKEFLQIFRHKVLARMIFLMPIIQLLILAHAADFEVKNISLHLIDLDQSSASRRLIGQFQASRHFRITGVSFSLEAGMSDLQTGRADLVLHLPPRMEYDLRRNGIAQVQVLVNAINGVKAGVASSYTNAIIQDFSGNLRAEWLGIGSGETGAPIDITFSNWFNPGLEYSAFMVPGILVLLVSLIGMFLSSMNIVKEKEVGTIEQLNVTPIRKHQFITGKLLPFWVLGMLSLAIGMAVGKLVFDIPIVGSIGLVFLFAGAYLLVLLGFGLLVSTITDTQQQAMFLAWFFLLVFILLSGLFTPIESMPDWAQKLTWFNPVAYFVEVMRLVLLKGSVFADVQRHFTVILSAAIVVNALAGLNYRKTSG